MFHNFTLFSFRTHWISRCQAWIHTLGISACRIRRALFVSRAFCVFRCACQFSFIVQSEAISTYTHGLMIPDFTFLVSSTMLMAQAWVTALVCIEIASQFRGARFGAGASEGGIVVTGGLAGGVGPAGESRLPHVALRAGAVRAMQQRRAQRVLTAHIAHRARVHAVQTQARPVHSAILVAGAFDT